VVGAKLKGLEKAAAQERLYGKLSELLQIL
jgi:hypothetical protein